jgi:hypothetical protein
VQPTAFTIPITIHCLGQTFVNKVQLIFRKFKNDLCVGPFLFIGVPGHIAIGHQPNYAFVILFGNGKVKEGIAAHFDGKLIALFFGAAGKGHAPPLRYFAYFLNHLTGAYVYGNAAIKIQLFHDSFLTKDHVAAATGIVKIGS